MTETITILPPRTTLKDSPCEYELYLQTAVATFVTEYTVSLSLTYPPRLRKTWTLHGASVHIGAHFDAEIIWGIRYLDLKVCEDKKLRFLIKILFPDSHLNKQGECAAPMFSCVLWAFDDYLRFELADKNGKRIRRFRLNKAIKHGDFHVVVMEIGKQLREMRKIYISG